MTSKIVDDFIESDPFLKGIFSFQKEKGYIKKRVSKSVLQDVSIMDEGGDEKLVRLQQNLREQKQEIVYEQYDKLEDVPKITSLKEKNPFKIDFLKELQKLSESNVFIKQSVRSMQEKSEKSLLSIENEQFSRFIFYRLLSMQIPHLFDLQPDIMSEHQTAEDFTKAKMAKKYLKTFTRLPKPKDQLIHYLIFANIYLANMLCFKIFKSEKERFNIQFLFNSIHLVVYETTGMFVSESYIHTSIDRFFTSKFMEYEREEYVRLQKIINQQNKIKDEQFLGFQLPKLQDSTIVESRFQDNLSKMLNRKKMPRRRCVSQTSFSRSRITRGGTGTSGIDDSSSQDPSSQHQSFSITQPLMHSRNEKRSISHQRMSKSFKDDENSNNPTNQSDMSDIVSQMKDSQGTNRKFLKRNFNCASIGPAMSNALDKQERVLIGIPQNIVQHRLKVTDIGRGNLYEMLEDLWKVRQQRKDYKQQDVVVKKVDLLQQYGLDYQEKVALNREHYINSNKELQDRFLQNMIEMNYVLRKKREKVNTLPSSESTVKNLKRHNFEYMEEGIPNFILKKLNYNGDYQSQEGARSSEQIKDNEEQEASQLQSNRRSSSLQYIKKQYSEQGSSFRDNLQGRQSDLDSTFNQGKTSRMINLNLILEEQEQESVRSRNENNSAINGQQNASILKKRMAKFSEIPDNNQNTSNYSGEKRATSPTKTINFSTNLTQSNVNHQYNKSFYQKQSFSMRNLKQASSATKDEQTSNMRKKDGTTSKTEVSPPQKGTNTTSHLGLDKNLSFSQKVNTLSKKFNLTNYSDRESSGSPYKGQDYEKNLPTDRKISTIIITKDSGPSEEEIYDKYHNRDNSGKGVYDQMILDQQKKDVLYKPNKNKLERMYNDMTLKQEDKDKEYENLQYKFQKSIKTAYKAKDIAKKMKLVKLLFIYFFNSFILFIIIFKTRQVIRQIK